MFSTKGRRGLVIIVMALAAFAFAGVSIILPLMGAFQNSPQAATVSVQEQLEAEAKGYESVLQREPDNLAALQGLIEVRRQQNNLQAIVPVLERLVSEHPDQPDYQILLAQTKQQLNDLEGAAQEYRTVLETRPGDVNALKGLSDLLVQQQRPQAAIGLLEDTLNKADEANRIQPGSIDPTSVRVLLGELYFNQGQYDQAIAVFDQAIQADPQDFGPVLGKALVLQAQGKTEEAAPLFAAAETLAPDRYKDQIRALAIAPASPTATDLPAEAGTESPAADPEAETSEAAPEEAAPESEAAPVPNE